MTEFLLQTTTGRFISTMFISMMPVVELRGGLPYGIALGLDYPLAVFAAILGNMIPVPFIMLFIRKIFDWIKVNIKRFGRLIEKLEQRAHEKGQIVQKYRLLGLLILVAIPLPGTGAWTGSLVAAVLDIRIKHAFPIIFAGVCIAAAIMTAVTFGVGRLI